METHILRLMSLRQHAQKHTTNDKSLYDITIVPSKAGRPKVGRRSRPAAIPNLSDRQPPFEAHGSDTTPDSGRRNRRHTNPHLAYLDPNKAYRVTNEAEYLESTMTRSGSNLSSDTHLQELERRADMAFKKEACDHIISLTSERDGLRARVQFLETTLKELGVECEVGGSEIWPPLSIDRDTDQPMVSNLTNWQAASTSRDGPSENPTQRALEAFTTSDHSNYYSEPSTSMDQTMTTHLPMKQALMHRGVDVPDARSQRSETHTPVVSNASSFHHGPSRVDASDTIRGLHNGVRREGPELSYIVSSSMNWEASDLNLSEVACQDGQYLCGLEGTRLLTFSQMQYRRANIRRSTAPTLHSDRLRPKTAFRTHTLALATVVISLRAWCRRRLLMKNFLRDGGNVTLMSTQMRKTLRYSKNVCKTGPASESFLDHRLSTRIFLQGLTNLTLKSTQLRNFPDIQKNLA
jgi:hypothetical protein